MNLLLDVSPPHNLKRNFDQIHLTAVKTGLYMDFSVVHSC